MCMTSQGVSAEQSELSAGCNASETNWLWADVQQSRIYAYHLCGRWLPCTPGGRQMKNTSFRCVTDARFWCSCLQLFGIPGVRLIRIFIFSFVLRYVQTLRDLGRSLASLSWRAENAICSKKEQNWHFRVDCLQISGKIFQLFVF